MLSLELDKIKNDLILISGQFQINTNSNATAQLINTRLRTISREWFLNNNLGIDYFNRIFVDNYDLTEIEAIFKTEILNTSHVIELLDFDLRLDSATRHLTINFKAKTSFSDIIQDNINIGF